MLGAETTVSITGITGAGRKRVIVQSGDFAWLLPEEEVSRLGLSIDSSIDLVVLDSAAMELQPRMAWNDAVRYMARAEHTSGQLQSYLESKKYMRAVAASVVERALRCGLIDDARYAEIYVRSHTRRSPLGPVRIRIELARAGISAEIIECILAKRDCTELFGILVETIRNRYGRLELQKARRRAAGYLAGRGFDADLSYRVIKEALVL